METVRLTAAQALLRFLDQQYVELDGREYKFVQGVIGIFGHGNVTGIGEALENEPLQMTYLQGHNEQGMVHTAVAYAKQRNRLGIYACTTSIGPGALNMVTGAAVATVNRIPVLLLPGDVFACRQPDPVLQQLEVPSDYTVSANDAFRPVSRYFDRITRPEQLMASLLQAMRVLTDPADTGAVTLALPQDVQAEAFDYPVSFFAKRVHHLERRPPDTGSLQRAAQAVRNARRPLLIAGGGVHYSHACEALREFAEAFGIPVAETQAGKSALPWDHPLNVGGIGVTGSKAANVLARESDLILAVGTRLTDFTTSSKTAFADSAKVLAVNVAAMDAVKMDAIPVICDAKEGLTAIQEALAREGYRSSYEPDEIAGLRADWNAEVDRLYSVRRDDGLAQTAVIGAINQAVGDDAIIVAAAGGLPGDLHRLWRAKTVKSYHMEYGFSCMGYEVAGALGVKLAEPDKEVYAMVGDGSYLMLHSELLTSIQENRKITVLLFDNSGYQCIHHLQKGHGSGGFGNEFRYRSRADGRLTGDILPIDFCQYAESLGAKGFRAQTLEELREALEAAKQSTVSVLIHIRVLPGTGTDNYESWWRVGVAEVSRNEDVTRAYQAAQEKIRRARPY
ncbi:MAG: 3D-(3,5/4)-trihydroxycyclohexane-1,2-dione acylhydrolase (decyclizing) [Alicyclobacillus sp.]|nr:3D-(3,5/4)-trihydroxycyclohexane-1,2-dione acylhydrolase (decyclizing) [Alicyclobacillus sp.]